MARFPSDDWRQALMIKLNSDDHYANVARNWEGDIMFIIEPGGVQSGETRYYLDLWHGKCRDAYTVDQPNDLKPTFIFRGPYESYVSLLKGEIDPLQAMLTHRISVQGNMEILMHSMPTVLDFLRCCREVTDSYL